MIYALFEQNDELTAIFKIAGVVCWILAAFASAGGGRVGRIGGSIGLLPLGLALFFFPEMWREATAAF